MSTAWNVTYRVRRQQGQAPARVEEYRLSVDPDEYVLDGVERIWAFHDRSLTFRHACHHSTCGACGMVVNGVERLSCITRIRDIVGDGGTITVEPLRNFALVSDLVVDMSRLYAALEGVGFSTVTPGDAQPDTGAEELRLVDCIECGLCISACPVMATALSSLGPAPLAAVQHDGTAGAMAGQVDSHERLWRCHSSFECSAVCPSGVDPAARIMALRRQVLGQRLRQLRRPRK
jgi:succinate dehydrogenase / fumarate reductase iron-sulfur subunit